MKLLRDLLTLELPKGPQNDLGVGHFLLCKELCPSYNYTNSTFTSMDRLVLGFDTFSEVNLVRKRSRSYENRPTTASNLNNL